MHHSCISAARLTLEASCDNLLLSGNLQMGIPEADSVCHLLQRPAALHMDKGASLT
jgi:hypothetical protein